MRSQERAPGVAGGTDMKDPVVDSILTGKVLSADTIPGVKSFQIKVFLCCTSTDMEEERNAIIADIIPKIREYAREKHGLEFHYLDLKWGHTDAIDDYETREFFVKELLRCQSLSAGPQFVAFIGQKYGPRPPPALISSDVFELIRRTLHGHKGRKARGAALLDVWYRKNTNSIPPIYVLLPASAEMFRQQAENNTDNLQRYQEVLSKLNQVLQYGVEQCCKEGTLPPDALRNYFISDLENELKQGTSIDPGEKSLVFVRTIEDLLNYVSESQAQTFTEVCWNSDAEKWEQNHESATLLNSLVTHTVKERLPEWAVQEFSILWRYDSGVHPVLHRPYILDFCNSFHKCMLTAIDKTAAQYEGAVDEDSLVYKEVLCHWQHARAKSAVCHDRGTALAAAGRYLMKGGEEEPMVLYGASGVGKTTTMAAIQFEIAKLPLVDTIVVPRYIGLTTSSCDVLQLLHSICAQLHSVLQIPEHDLPVDSRKLNQHFFALLENFPKNKNLIVLLDGLESLSSSNEGHSLQWLPVRLGTNVRIIVSTSPGKHDIFSKLKRDMLQKHENFVELHQLSADSCVEIVVEWLQWQRQTVTGEQRAALVSAFRKCSLPLYARLLLNEVLQWRSFDHPDKSHFGENVSSYVDKFFESMEERHGLVMVSRSIAYMTASSSGLSDVEMEDILSLDDVVIGSVLKDPHPALRRLPPYAWARLRDDMESFLTLKEMGEVNVYYWFHECFADGARKRYLSEPAQAREIHSTMSDYYLGCWHGKSKSFVHFETNASTRQHSTLHSSADRHVQSQPLLFNATASGNVKFNKRKYSQLPMHLCLSGRLEELKSLVMFNYEWIYNKVKALSIQPVLTDVSSDPSPESRLLESALRSIVPAIARNIDSMAPELIGRLLPYCDEQHANITRLVRQCETFGIAHCALLPAYSYGSMPCSPLIMTLDNSEPADALCVSFDGNSLLSKSSASPDVLHYDLSTGMCCNTVATSLGQLNVTPNRSHLLIVDNDVEKAIKVHNAINGTFLGQFIPCNFCNVKSPNKCRLETVSISDTHSCLVVRDTEASHFLVFALPFCDFRKTVVLDGRRNIATMLPNGSYALCSSGRNMMTFRLGGSYELVDSTQLDHRPTLMVISSSSTTVFLATDVSHVVALIHLQANGRTQTVTKFSLRDELSDDTINTLVASNTQNMLMVTGHSNVIVYCSARDMILLHIRKPQSIPAEFRLPKHDFPSQLAFSDTKFTLDDKYVLCAVFRDVQVWDLMQGKHVKTVQTPIGVVAQILLCPRNGHILTRSALSSKLYVWDLEEAKGILTLDRLTGKINSLNVSSDGSVCFATCEDSDEVGVIDMGSGQLRHLLTHESTVTRVLPSLDGSYALVSLAASKAKLCNKVWYLNERRMIGEFGVAPGVSVTLTKQNAFIHFSPQSSEFRAPYSVTQYDLTDGFVRETAGDFTVSFLIGSPFVTEGDKYLVVLTAENYLDHEARYTKPSILAFSLRSNLAYKLYDGQELGFLSTNRLIKEVRTIASSSNQIIAMYSHLDSTNKEAGLGFFVLDLHSHTVMRYSDCFMSQQTDLRSIDVSRSGAVCVNTRSGIVYSMTTGDPVAHVDNDGQPLRLMCDGQCVAYYCGTDVLVERILDGRIIAHCEVHSHISCMEVGQDELTLTLGCTDGAVVAFVLLDGAYCDTLTILSRVRNRRAASRRSTGTASVAWDSVQRLITPIRTRATSVVNMSSLDKERLQMIESLHSNRPKTSNGHTVKDRTLLLSRATSRACRLM